MLYSYQKVLMKVYFNMELKDLARSAAYRVETLTSLSNAFDSIHSVFNHFKLPPISLSGAHLHCVSLVPLLHYCPSLSLQSFAIVVASNSSVVSQTPLLFH